MLVLCNPVIGRIHSRGAWSPLFVGVTHAGDGRLASTSDWLQQLLMLLTWDPGAELRSVALINISSIRRSLSTAPRPSRSSRSRPLGQAGTATRITISFCNWDLPAPPNPYTGPCIVNLHGDSVASADRNPVAK